MNRPKVLFVDRQGALAVWSLLIPVARQLEESGWDTGFVMMSDESGRGIPDITCSLGIFRITVPYKRWPGDLLRQSSSFRAQFDRLVARVSPDVIHVNFAIPGIWARQVAGRRRVPFLVSTQHELAGSLAPHLRLGLWSSRRRVDVHTYVSDTVAASFGHAGAPVQLEDEVVPSHVVIRNGVDIDTIRPFRASRDAAVPGRIVAPGRLMPEKGQALLVRALAEVRRTHPQAHLIFAGSGPEEDRLRDLAEELGVSGAVTFKGWLSREALWRLLASGQVAAFASDGKQEGFGLALAEAALLETPLVVSRIAAFREVMAGDEDAAWWFRTEDEGSLVSALRAALSAVSAERARRIARAARAARERATQSRMIEQYTRLYDRFAAVIAGRPKQDYRINAKRY
ncbi:glycosyltransferase, group 1 [Salinisphaera sp. PC39]|uniref:glycosyltransferase family 4 protein n=1 Tax=Salinisphaera sp. PC39 TaxID=1304156 RepID=UPI00333E2C84